MRKVLVIDPLRVARDTWPTEIEKWDHLRGLTYSVAVGSEVERKAALRQRVSVYIINRETKRIDPGSFIVMLQANEVEGEGFKRLELGEQS